MDPIESPTKNELSPKGPGGFDFIRFTPYFMSSVLFFSILFSVLAPLPLLWIRASQWPTWKFWIAVLTNLVVVFLVSRDFATPIFFIFSVISISLLVPFFLIRRRESPARTVFFTLLTVFGLLVGGFLAYCGVKSLSPIEVYLSFSDQVAQQFLSMLKEAGSLSRPPSFEEVQSSVRVDILPGIVISLSILIWSNVTFLLWLNPNQIRDRLGISRGYFGQWRAPEWLIWPTLLAAGYWAIAKEPGSEIAWAVLQVLLMVYAIQGFGILWYALNAFKIFGFFRTLVLVSLVFLSPYSLLLMVSLGLFDLWFDFRRKFGQT